MNLELDFIFGVFSCLLLQNGRGVESLVHSGGGRRTEERERKREGIV